jgi:DNA-formamidopyrimidine glycosylase
MWQFFQKYPTAHDAAQADHEEVANMVAILGLKNRRAMSLIKMSRDYISKLWHSDPKGSLHAVGKYAEDAYRIFCVGDWMDVNPQDHALNDYHDWLWKNHSEDIDVPEGPECRTISDGLNKFLNGKRVTGVSVLSGRYARHGGPDGITEFLATLPAKVIGSSCHGKFIYIHMDNGWNVWCTLGMTGSWRKDQTQHSRVSIDTDGGTVYFTDMRNFGTLSFVNGNGLLLAKIKSLGPDMLTNNLHDSDFIKIIRSDNRTITEAIMDQSVIAGVGNYLKAESLYFAQISPHRLCNSLTDQELISLNQSIKSTIRMSYKTGGATIRNYAGINGQVGQYSSRFAVYSQKTDPAGNPVVKEKTADGRMTHWVPTVQR